MKIVLQRVQQAKVTVDGAVVGNIGNGLLALVGVHLDDTTAEAEWLASKCVELRIFDDAQGEMNLALTDTGGEILVVSQFTLLADCRKGRRPSWHEAAPPQKGRELYEYFVECLRPLCATVQTGVFGASMKVELINDGPVTIILERTARAACG